MNMHAKIGDLPGWPCPPRVRDIATTPDSWGWVLVAFDSGGVAFDELGFLWIRAAIVPRYRLPNPAETNPGGIVFWTEDGIGLYIHPRSYQALGTTSRLDHQPDEWLPVTVVVPDLPAWIAAGVAVS